MLNLSDSHHFRKLVAGMCMVAAPLCALGATVVQPRLHTGEAAQLSSIASHADRWFIAGVLAFIAICLAIPAVLGLMHMLRERRAAYGHVGGCLALIGLVGFAVSTGVGFVAWQMAQAGDRAAMVSLFKSVNDATGTMILIGILPFLFAVGMIVLGMGLYAARAVPWWMAAFFAAGAVLLTLAGVLGSNAVDIIGAALLFVGLGSVGLQIVGETDADWEHTPEYRGFRPLAGMR